jgi:hypothetical protein
VSNIQEQVRLLTLLANGLVQIYDQSLRGISLSSPYPKALQQGMHKLAAHQVNAGLSPIASLQEFLILADYPLNTWGINFDEELVGHDDQLIEHSIPTQFCLDCTHEQGPDALEEETLMHEVMAICKEAERPDTYTAFRNLLISRPVLTTLELQRAKQDTKLRPVRDLLIKAYISAPLSAVDNSVYRCCERCGSLLLRMEGNHFECENERCRQLRAGIGHTLSSEDSVLWLENGLRRYIARPGLAEIDLQDRLVDFGLAVEMWPNYDAYDLRIHINNAVWAVDVKDWSNPFRLAQSVGPIRRIPEWDRAFYVFPDERKHRRPDYDRAFLNRWKKPVATEAMMMSDFVFEVKTILEGGDHATD